MKEGEKKGAPAPLGRGKGGEVKTKKEEGLIFSSLEKVGDQARQDRGNWREG